MPFCPTCRAEYRPGIERCADCDVPLVDELPEEPERYEPPPPTGNDVPIARADSLAIAEMWAELLGDDDISCRIVPAGVGDTMLVPGQTLWELRVAAIDAVRARELLPADAHPLRPAEDDPEAADSQAMNRALRWFIIAGVLFIVLMILVLGGRYFT
jgi:hypothetical protein